MPLLTLQIDGKNKRFDIPTDKPVFLGRAKECDINLMSPGVSRRHAVIIARGGICGIKDLDSFNGTFLNGAAVTKPVALKDGDVIKISSFTIVFRLSPSNSGMGEAGGVPDSPADGESRPSARFRLPRAMTDSAAVHYLMNGIDTEEGERSEGEDTCVLPTFDLTGATAMEEPDSEIEEK